MIMLLMAQTMQLQFDLYILAAHSPAPGNPLR